MTPIKKLSANPLFAKVRTLSALAALAVLALPGTATATSIVYQASDSTNNIVPEAEDGTPNRPTGDQMGNTVTLSGTDRFLTVLTIRVGTNDVTIPDQTVTVKLFANDGAADPGGSGLLQPGTLIDSSVSSVSFLTSGISVPVTFTFPSVQVPDTFTFIVDFSPGSPPGKLLGLKSNNSGPTIGSSVNTLWYGTGAANGWLTNSTWAIDDGAVINVVDAVIQADATGLVPVPEPSSALLLALGVAVQCATARARRRVLVAHC